MTGGTAPEPPRDPELAVSHDGDVATIWLDRPAKRNAVTFEMWRRLADACAALAGRADVRALVVRGVGDHFCAGADVRGLGEVDQATYGAANSAAEQAIAEFPTPTIAAITGSCVGGGASIALACDIRVADATARFGITPARLGIVYPPHALERAVRAIGPSAVKHLIFTAELIDAARALRIGLVDEVVPEGALDERIGELTSAICARSALTQRATKEMVDGLASTGSLDAELARRWTTESERSGERAEGLEAFVGGREPRFPWR